MDYSETREKRILQLLDYKKQLEDRQTPYEKKFYRLLLHAREIREEHNKSRSTIHRQYIFTDGRIAYIADFYLPSRKIVFEIDGYHHKHQKKYDDRRTQFLNKRGINVIRFWNHELDMPNIIEVILHAIKEKKR
jgi:very-short-patch-repair endonuclease